jgi:hypothetical protein
VGVNTQTQEASALLTLIDNCSRVRIAAAEGSASKTDISGSGSLFGTTGGGSGRVGLSGHNHTPQGKVITAAFMDACKNTSDHCVKRRLRRSREVWGKADS